MKKTLLAAIVLLFTITANAQLVPLDYEGRDSAYVENIKKRAQKIVDGLQLTDKKQARNVCNIIANRYFLLNDIHANMTSHKRMLCKLSSISIISNWLLPLRFISLMNR